MKYHLIPNLIKSHNISIIGPPANAARLPAADECAVYLKKTQTFTVPRTTHEISHDGNIL